MTLYIQNPDRLWFKKNIAQYIRGARPMNKYEYILDNLLKLGKINVILPITGASKRERFRNKIFRFIKFAIWCKINKLQMSSFDISYSYAELKEKDTVFVFFHDNFASTPTCCSPKEYEKTLQDAICKFVVHLNHYVYETPRGSSILYKMKNVEFCAESRLEENSAFFRKMFKWYTGYVAVLPFCVGDRFLSKPVICKNGRGVVTGAITYPIYEKHFMDFFLNPILQPERKFLYDNKSFFENVDVFSEEYGNFKERSALQQIRRRFKSFIVKSFKCDGQKYYLKLNIVDLYNNYSFVICPDEIIGLPGIGAFEAMACGSVLIHKSSKILNEYGMNSGEHFITYNGSIENLDSVIKYYNKHINEYYLIQKNSISFVNAHFRSKDSFQRFLKLV